ncbi:MAG: class I SAM-dependent methyltransferase [Thaumarchaeota archaeon]|nr:class I SAM-dependent methyltransferase [Nitrososphaerota archaeon]
MYRLGPEDYQSGRHIRKILRLARASKEDVFFDLGCGRGSLCIVAVLEFGVKKAVGIELHRGRAAKAAASVRELGLADRIEIRNEDFMESDLAGATIVYSGLQEIEEDVALLERELRAGCRVVSLFLPFVGILPAASDYPFYMMKLPFKKTRDPLTWVEKTLFKKASVAEFYRELDNDREYRYDKRALKRMMENRLSGGTGVPTPKVKVV